MSISELYPGIGVALETKPPRGTTVRSPLLAPGRGSRGTPVYNVHSYHTKVPPEAIEPYITHHTRPGELVLDPFCGSGMTGVAAARLGRRAILNDLAPAAVHIAWNVTHGCAAGDLRQAAGQVLSQIDAVVSGLYAAPCGGCGSPAKIAYTIWSDILACDHCGNQVTVWDGATDRMMGTMRPTFGCPRCGRQSQRRGAKRQGRRPCLVATDCVRCGRLERAPVADDLALLEDISASPIDHWYPTVPIGPEREMYLRSALHLQGIRTVADFYSPRNLRVLSAMWAAIRSVDDLRLRQALAEPHHVIQPFDQERWAMNYNAYEAEAALGLFTAARNWNLKLMASLPADAFRRPLLHPERGEMTFRTLVETMAGHDLNHIRQIEAIAELAAGAQA